MSTGQMVGQVNAAALISTVQGFDASASASAAAAAASEAVAVQSEVDALAAQAAAETAADLAQNASGTYADTTAGLAAVASGAYFYVPDGTGGLIRYLDSAGTAVEVGRVASGMLLQVVASPDYPAVLLDSENRVVLGVLDDGTIEVDALQAATVNGVPAAPLPTGTYEDEINHVISYGQSLSLGADSEETVPLTLAQRHNAVMFSGGVRPNDFSSVPAVMYASLQPLVEQYAPTGGTETPVGGTCEAISDLILAENGLAYGDHSFVILGSAAGEGSKSIAQLAKGTAFFTRLIEHVTYGKSLSNAAGKTYGVRAVTWAQGEQDESLGTTAATYIAALNQLVIDLNTDIKAITGQTSDIHLVSSQLGSNKAYGRANPTIAVALHDASLANPLIHIAVPNYLFQHNYTDQIHMKRLSYKLKGFYFGKCIKRICVDGATWAPVQPISANRQGSVVVVRFNVPRGPLVFDTMAVRLNTNYGFSLVTSADVAITVNAVELLGDDRVKITAATAIPAGAKVRYGFVEATDVAAWGTYTGPLNGPRGNLRDSEGDVAIADPDGLAYPLHNWAPYFVHQVA